MHQRDVPGARYAESENYQYVAIPTYGNVRSQVILPPEDKASTNAIADMPEDISALSFIRPHMRLNPPSRIIFTSPCPASLARVVSIFQAYMINSGS